MSPARRKYACSELRAAVAVDGLLRGRQGLAEHLAAEHVARADVAAFAAEEILFQAFELKQAQQFFVGVVVMGGAWAGGAQV